MKFNKLYIAVFVLVAAFFAGCEDYVDTVVPGDPFEGAYSVTFPSENEAIFELDPNGDKTFTLTVSRDTMGTAIEASVSVIADTSGLFTVPATVSFAADEKTADLVVSLDAAAVLGVSYGLGIEIGSEFNNPYSAVSSQYFGEISLSVWGTLGTVQFYDYWVFSTDIFDEVIEVILEQNGEDNSMYRITNPYTNAILVAGGWDADWGWGAGTIGGATQNKIVFTVNADKTVSWGAMYTGLLYQAAAGQEIQAKEGAAHGFDITDPNVAIYDAGGTNIEYFELHPSYHITGIGGFGENPAYLGMVGYDLATDLGLPVFGATK